MESTNAANFLSRPIASSKLGSAFTGKPGAASQSPGVLDRKLYVESSDAEFARQTCLALGKSSYALPQKKMSEAAREIEKFWPAMPEYGYVGISTGYAKIRPDEEDFPQTFGDHRYGFGMDLRTFADVFSDPKGLVEHLSEAADTLVARWNEKNGSDKNVGNRQPDQECFGHSEG